jgi:hypothetical protein
MKWKHRSAKPDFINDLEARQRNIWMGDQIRNSGIFYRTAWHGSPDAPLVQRIGLAILGVVITGQGIALAKVMMDDRAPFIIGLFVALPFAYIGLRLIRNSLKR